MNGWCDDFSYAYYAELLETASRNFRIQVVADAPAALDTAGQRHLVLRHDVDVSLQRALQLARVESGLGISATYMVMTNSPLYRVESSASRAILHELVAMGHEVALHFDFDSEAVRASSPALAAVEPMVAAACDRIEAIIAGPVRSVSFHRPQPQLQRGPLWIAGRVNAYARDLMHWYLSDSAGRWREGEPLPRLRNPDRPVLQLLTHPIWWGPRHESPAQRLQSFVWSATAGQSLAEREEFALTLGRHIDVPVPSPRPEAAEPAESTPLEPCARL
jgi:hypothetical protein